MENNYNLSKLHKKKSKNRSTDVQRNNAASIYIKIANDNFNREDNQLSGRFRKDSEPIDPQVNKETASTLDSSICHG